MLTDKDRKMFNTLFENAFRDLEMMEKRRNKPSEKDQAINCLLAFHQEKKISFDDFIKAEEALTDKTIVCNSDTAEQLRENKNIVTHYKILVTKYIDGNECFVFDNSVISKL